MLVLFATMTSDLTPHWLQRLGLMGAPSGTVLHSAEWTLRGAFPWWAALIVVILTAIGSYLLYARESARLSLPRRLILATLRTLLIGMVLLLLLRPILLAEFHGRRPREVVLLVDVSQSMSQSDRRVTLLDRYRLALAKGLLPPSADLPDPSTLDRFSLQDCPRIEIVRDVLQNETLALRSKLLQLGPVQPFLFERRLLGITNEDLLGSLQAQGSQTALADSIHEVLTRLAGELPGAIVVITDGRDNASKRTLEEVARICGEKEVPLHIYGVGSTEGGVLQFKEVKVPSTVFVDEKPDVVDDPLEIPIVYRARGFKKGTLLLTAKFGDQLVTEKFPIREGENLRHTLKLVPRKGKPSERPLSLQLQLAEDHQVGDEVRKVVQVRSSRVKVLLVENTPRREYHFIQPVLNRDRRVLTRIYLADGDPKLAENPPDKESGTMFLDRFPDHFPDPDPRDPDPRPYDLLLLGDVPYTALGDRGARAIQRFVKEGGGLVVLAGPHHAPAEFVSSPLAEVLPVEITRQEFPPEELARTIPFKPVLTYDGEQHAMLALADSQEENVKLWKEDLWKHSAGFWWHYPVENLRPGATALLVHPDKKVAGNLDPRPMPVVATHYYGKGEVLFIGSDETWRWRDSTADRLTARFWGQVITRLGLPHLLGNARRSQLELERGSALLGQPGTIKARLLDAKYDPVVRPFVRGTLVPLDAPEGRTTVREVVLRRISGQPGEYRGTLPHEVPGRHEFRLAGGEGLEAATLPFTVELPPRHELEEAGLAEEALRNAAALSGGLFYREEDLAHLADSLPRRTTSFVQRQEILLWGPLALLAFVLLITCEWLLRKISNLS